MPYKFNKYFASAKELFLNEFNIEWAFVLDSINLRQAQLFIGNRLRPQITFWGYLASLSHEQILQNNYNKIAKIAVSIELLHKASLLFDDWLDDDDARHGEPTFHVEFTPQITVIFALHLISIAAKRIKDIVISENITSNQYLQYIDTILNTIFAMSQGALNEIMLSGDELFDLEKVKEIVRLETSEIIGNSIQLGYIIGGGQKEQAAIMLKHIGNQCGYLFQTMNDLEAFGNSIGNAEHKGSINFDIDNSRKNIAVAILYQMATKSDKNKIKTASGEEISKIAVKYHLIGFIIDDMENIFKKMILDIQTLYKYGVSEEWIDNFCDFIKQVKIIAHKRLS